MKGSLQAEILARLDDAPEARCLAFYDSHGSFAWRSRADVHRRAAAVARHFAHQGLQRGDVCVLVLPSDEIAVASLLATLRLGAIPLLIAPPSLVGGNLELHETLRQTLRRTRARLAVCAASLERDRADLERSAPATRFIFVGGDRWDAGDAHAHDDRDAAASAPILPKTRDVAMMQLTSGTTAAPRICVWDHRIILAALDGMTAAMRLSPDDVCVNWTPLYHDMGLVNNFLLCMARGVPLVLLSPQEFVRRPALWLRALSDVGATITWSPNFGFAIAARKADDRELEGVRLDRVRAFWNAAERIHLDTIDAFHRRFAAFGVRRDALKTNYGCAENVGGATFSACDAPPRHERLDRRLADERGIARPIAVGPGEDHTVDDATMTVVSAGRPNPGVGIWIVSPRGRTLPEGRIGEICLDTPSRMLRYHGNPRETMRALRDGLLHTGDLGYVRDGELFWTGRVRERITVKGKKIDPSAFEAVLASTPGLREGCFVAFGVPEQDIGTERVVVISEVRSPDASDLEGLASSIRRRCFLRLGIAPDEVMMVRPGTLAKTSSGKRRHRYFRTLYLAGGLEDARAGPP